MRTDVPDRSEAAQFLKALAPDNALTFNTFQDARPRPPKDPLACVLHGEYERVAAKLERLNSQGAGVFVMVNRGDLHGRKEKNVTAVRAVFLDLDGAPLKPVLAGPVRPPIVCESSPKRYHAIWPVSGMPLADFRGAQLALAERFGGDKMMKDLPRVLRVPGYVHAKGAPFISRLLECEPRAIPNWRELAGALGLPRKAEAEEAADRWKVGERNSELFRFACGLRTKGLTRDDAIRRLTVANAQRCVVPLAKQELLEIITNAWKSETKGFARIPHQLLDKKEFRALPDAAKSAVLALLRQFNGSNNGRITFTRNEAESWGLSKYKRSAALAALSRASLIEWEEHARPGTPGQRATPDLFRLLWLPDQRKCDQ
jgi:hypothetical protein